MPSPAYVASVWSVDDTDVETKPESSEVLQSDILCGGTGRYLILDFMGEGAFGKVAKAVNFSTSQIVALKILQTEQTAEREIKMLEAVSVLDPVKTNVVQFFEQFTHKGHTCLVFEMLDRSLFQLLEERDWEPLSLTEIRPITHQLLKAFNALKAIGIVHSDLKPDNVMLANHPSEPFRVKLIDFGVSCTTQEDSLGMKIQPLGYRAPEVFLGLPICEAIDMWGLGCVLVFLYIAQHGFAPHCEYQSMKDIVDVVGQPADHLLRAGIYTHDFFTVNRHWDNPRWWMKTPREYQLGTGIEPESWESPFKRLDDLITSHPEVQESIELEDRRAFVSLLKCLLHTDPQKRITPRKALTHPFVTMAHLVDEIETSSYGWDSLEQMAVILKDQSDEEPSPHGEAEEAPKGEEPAAAPPPEDEGSAVVRSCDGAEDTPPSADGAQAAAGLDTTGSVVEEPAVSQGAANPAEASGVSPEEGPPANVRRSPLKRFRKFIGRTIRTLFRRK